MEVLGDITTEVRRIIRVHRHLYATFEHVEDVVLGHVVEYTQLGVRQRADGQRNLFVDDALHQSLIFDGPDAVVDPLDFQQVEGFPDVLRWTFLTRVGHGEESFGACAVEHPLELAGRVAHFRAVQPDRDERVTKRQGLVQSLLRFVFAQVTQEAEDQAAADSQLLLAILECGGDAVEYHLEGNAPVGVGLRVEERLGVDNVLFLAAQQVGPGQVVEIL